MCLWSKPIQGGLLSSYTVDEPFEYFIKVARAIDECDWTRVVAVSDWPLSAKSA